MKCRVQNLTDRQIEWINCAKFLAVFAVLMDHTHGVLYTNQHIALASYYSVSLFILISGYLSFSSNLRHDRPYGQSIIQSCKRITLAYLLATFVYTIATYKYFDFKMYLDTIIHFNASEPFYYVLLYIQLMIANKAVYKFVIFSKRYRKMCEILYDFFLGIIIFIIASLTTRYTNIFGVYGGGGKLLGGTYLLLFYVGMVLNKHKVFSSVSKPVTILIFIIASAAYWEWWRLICNGYQSVIDSKFPLGKGINPPSITFSVLALFMMFFCFGFFNLCSWNHFMNYIPKAVGWLGQHTLYIFLYHRLWLDFILVRFITIDNIQIKRVVYYTVMIFASVGLEYLVSISKHFIKYVFYNSSTLRDK